MYNIKWKRVNCMAVTHSDIMAPGYKVQIMSIHSWTRTAHLTHGHRILRLAEDFEMLRLTPDFKTLRLAGVWRVSGWRLSGT